MYVVQSTSVNKPIFRLIKQLGLLFFAVLFNRMSGDKPGVLTGVYCIVLISREIKK